MESYTLLRTRSSMPAVVIRVLINNHDFREGTYGV